MKNLRSVISAYVTLKKFTPGLQKIYTDKSTISATFSNSVTSDQSLVNEKRKYSKGA